MRKGFILSVLGTALLALFFLSGLSREEATLQNPLIEGVEKKVLLKDTVIEEEKTKIIQGELKENLKAGPYLLKGIVSVPRGAEVKIDEGVVIYTDTGSKLVIHGKLTADNTTFHANRLHPNKSYWHGLEARGGTINLKDTRISDATTALASEEGGEIKIADSRLENNQLGLATLAEGNITVKNSLIQKGDVGLQLVGGDTSIENLHADVLQIGMRILPESEARINGIKFTRLGKRAIVYHKQENLTISGLEAAEADYAAEEFILDGRDRPTFSWQGKEYQRGVVTIINK